MNLKNKSLHFSKWSIEDKVELFSHQVVGEERFSFYPSYHKIIKNNSSKHELNILIKSTFKLLGWDVNKESVNSISCWVEGKGTAQEKVEIFIAREDKSLKIESLSLNRIMRDLGRNSINVKMFIYAFQLILSAKKCEDSIVSLK